MRLSVRGLNKGCTKLDPYARFVCVAMPNFQGRRSFVHESLGEHPAGVGQVDALVVADGDEPDVGGRGRVLVRGHDRLGRVVRGVPVRDGDGGVDRAGGRRGGVGALGRHERRAVQTHQSQGGQKG